MLSMLATLRDILMICSGQSDKFLHGDVILSDGSSYTEGRVEVCFNGSWVHAVYDDQWSYQDAQVVCKQLGYPYSGVLIISFKPYKEAHFYLIIGQNLVLKLYAYACTGM